MTEEKIRVTFGHSTDENGEPFEFVEFICPSCKSATITVPTTKKESELLAFKCPNCEEFQYFGKPARPSDQNE
jgi:predicted RNA-binding Zn-ribbon protein involved in translation (DUF1610 family)